MPILAAVLLQATLFATTPAGQSEHSKTSAFWRDKGSCLLVTCQKRFGVSSSSDFGCVCGCQHFVGTFFVGIAAREFKINGFVHKMLPRSRLLGAGLV